MKQRKLLLALALAFALCLSLCVVAHAEDDETVTVPLNTPVEGVLNGYGDFSYAVNGGPMVVKVTVAASAPMWLRDWASGSTVDYVGKEFPHEYCFTNIQSTGEYGFSIYGQSGQPINYTVTVSTQPLSVNERESNDDWDYGWDEDADERAINPNVLTLSETALKGAIFNADGEADRDYYMFKLDSARSVDISVTQLDRAFNWEFGSMDYDWIGNEDVENYGYIPLTKPFSFTKRFDLDAGTYFFCLYNYDGGHTGRYEISAKFGASITPSVVVPKTATVTEGFELYGWYLYSTPSLATQAYYDFTLSSDKPDVLAVDPNDPYFAAALKLGKANLTLTVLGKTYTIKVTVAKNEFSRKKPIKPMKWQTGIFTSLKKARYEADGTLAVDIFVYNKSGKVLRGIDRPTIAIGWEPNSNSWRYYHIDWPAINFNKPIKNGAYGVYSLKITPEQFPMYKMDLRENWPEIGIIDNVSAKRVTFVDGRAKGVVEVNAPMN